jgi:hypothetical protein
LKNGLRIFDAYEPREVGRVLRLDKKKARKTRKKWLGWPRQIA